MILTIDKTHELKGNGYLLGVDGENGSEQLIIKVENETLLDKWAYIEFETEDGEKFTTERLSVVGGQIVYDIPNGLLPQGHVKVQVIFRDAGGFVWKSFVRQFAVNKSLNASDNLPIEYPDFIGEAQKLLDEITVESEKVDEVLESEEARRTEFAGWSESMGNLNTYDKRIINLEEAGVGVLFDYQEDNSTAYSKEVPEKALPYAILKEVGGTVKSVKCIGKNLFDFDKLSSVAGASINKENKTITIDAGNNNRYVGKVAEVMPSLVVGKTYFLNAVDTNSESRHIVYFNPAGLIVEFGTSFKCTQEIKNSDIAFYNKEGSTVANTISHIMVSETAKRYALPLTDSYIKVEPNGSVVFENDNGQAVPSEITFFVKK